MFNKTFASAEKKSIILMMLSPQNYNGQTMKENIGHLSKHLYSKNLSHTFPNLATTHPLGELCYFFTFLSRDLSSLIKVEMTVIR